MNVLLMVNVLGCAAVLLSAFSLPMSGFQGATCEKPANTIVAENCKEGNPSSDWDVNGSGDPRIQGFATDISVNIGETISFKVHSDSNAYP